MRRLHLWSDGVYRDRSELVARNVVLTKLDVDGNPTGPRIRMSGPVFVRLVDDGYPSEEE